MPRAVSFGIAALAVFALGTGIYLHFTGSKVLLANASKVSTPSSTQTAKNAATLPSNLPPSETVPSSSTTEPSSPSATSNSSTTPKSLLNNSTPNCKANMAEMQSDYNQDLEKYKKTLDQTLSFQVSLNISSQYIADYNKKVTDMYQQYLAEAKAEHCTCPIKAPTLLPDTYTLPVQTP